ncbi:hypothetical protein Daus18300_005709 [Diaporthe australafricana]|uniref:Uncharacterized protein n=1 Tax=Diaporthe australafricana TaxID=127596 RepID=A0ABR3X0E5_9PEZI
MEKDFNIPKTFILKASEIRADKTLKYPWFRSFINEYVGLTKPTANSLVDVFKNQAGVLSIQSDKDQLFQPDCGWSTQVALATEPATAVRTSSYSCGEPPGSQRLNTHSTKRQKTRDQTEGLETHVKTEPTDDGLPEMHVPHTSDSGGTNDANASGSRRTRTLTVLFHGMRDADIEESEHVQVYVPRNSKGVTINFL